MKALIAMSGGVDSSVAAYLSLKKYGQAEGCIMRLYENDMIGEDLFGTCCSLTDMQDARAVAERLNMPFHVFHYEHEFRDAVITPFAESYLRGETPNPCLNCNAYLKFDHLYGRAKEFGCDLIVTGHYARVSYDEGSGRYCLKRGVDAMKDQSYVLYMLTQEQLAHTFFPLGEYTKDAVREIALEHGFVNARKKESQDICFVPDSDYAAFIERYTGRMMTEGDFVDEDGNVLGRHKGIGHYTVGQRRGLGIASTESWYVKAILPGANEVVLTRADGVYSDRLIAREFNWVSVAPPVPGETVSGTAMVRYRGKETPCTVQVSQRDRYNDSLVSHCTCPFDSLHTTGSTVEILFGSPVRAVTPGQAVVVYDGERVIGGGIIV